MMGFSDRMDAMSAARANADAAFVDALADVRDEYVRVSRIHEEAEDRWLALIGDDDARVAAQQAWKDRVAARKALTDAAATADTARDAMLASAWTEIKAEA